MKLALTFFLVLTLLVNFGCASNIRRDAELFPALPMTALSPGDELEIRMQGEPEYNSIQKVRPDGRISVIGLSAPKEVMAAGLTPEELDNVLTDIYKVEIANPVSVVVNSYALQRVFVDGQVRAPGVIKLDNELTALEAVISAGGFNMSSADRKRVVVLRQKGDKRYAKMLNLDYMLENEVSEEFFLGPNDIVYVPRTGVVVLNQWIEQYLTNNVPFIGVLGPAVVAP